MQDLRFDNLLLTTRWDVEYHKGLELDKVYIIDFSESWRLRLGPGQQPPIDLPQSIIPKPHNMQRFDPYSFDVYCLGRVLESTLIVRLAHTIPPRDRSLITITQLAYRSRPKSWLLQRYVQWLVGAERGCTGVCRCRPTAQRARQVIVVLQWAIRGWTLLESAVHFVRSVLSPRRPPTA